MVDQINKISNKEHFIKFLNNLSLDYYEHYEE